MFFFVVFPVSLMVLLFFQDMMNIMARLASQNIGEVDWEPYIPQMFSRILRGIDLPVSYKSMKSSKNQCMWSADVSREIKLAEANAKMSLTVSFQDGLLVCWDRKVRRKSI
jgi:hypothetical protein